MNENNRIWDKHVLCLIIQENLNFTLHGPIKLNIEIRSTCNSLYAFCYFPEVIGNESIEEIKLLFQLFLYNLRVIFYISVYLGKQIFIHLVCTN